MRELTDGPCCHKNLLNYHRGRAAVAAPDPIFGQTPYPTQSHARQTRQGGGDERVATCIVTHSRVSSTRDCIDPTDYNRAVVVAALARQSARRSSKAASRAVRKRTALGGSAPGTAADMQLMPTRIPSSTNE
jgi:hypothetical protein